MYKGKMYKPQRDQVITRWNWSVELFLSTTPAQHPLCDATLDIMQQQMGASNSSPEWVVEKVPKVSIPVFKKKSSKFLSFDPLVKPVVQMSQPLQTVTLQNRIPAHSWGGIITQRVSETFILSF